MEIAHGILLIQTFSEYLKELEDDFKSKDYLTAKKLFAVRQELGALVFRMQEQIQIDLKKQKVNEDRIRNQEETLRDFELRKQSLVGRHKMSTRTSL